MTSTRPAVIFLPAVRGVYKEHFSSDSDSSLDAYNDANMNSNDQFTSELEDNDNESDLSKALERASITDVGSRTSSTCNSDEIEAVHCCSAKRKIDFTKKRTTNRKDDISSKVSGIEACSDRSTRQLRSHPSKDAVMDETTDSPTISQKIPTPKSESKRYFMRHPRRDTDAGSAVKTPEKRIKSTLELSKSAGSVSDSSKKPSRCLLKLPRSPVEITVTHCDSESGSTELSGHGRLLRSRTKSESQQKTAPSPRSTRTAKSKVPYRTESADNTQKSIPVTRSTPKRCTPRNVKSHDDMETSSSKKQSASHKMDVDDCSSGGSDDEDCVQNSKKSKAKESTKDSCRTPAKLRSKSEDRSKRGTSVTDKEPVKAISKGERELRSSRTFQAKSFTVSLPKCDNAIESTPTERRSTRTVKTVVPYGVELANDVHKSTPVKCSTRAKECVTPRNAKSRDDADPSTPCTRLKSTKKQPVSYKMDVDDCSGDGSSDDNFELHISSSDSSDSEDGDDDVTMSDVSSRDADSKDDDDDDIFYPNRPSSRAKNSQAPKTPRTPRTPRVNVRTLAPALPSRTAALSTPETPKDRAMRALHISSVPESLPCRKREYDTIYNFLLKKIKAVDGGFMYVYGIPGAGKTATVERVIKRLQMESKTKKIKKFTFVDINGMHLKQPKEAYCQILKKLEKLSASAPKAKSLLEQKFRTLFVKQPILLLIDEFDMLFDRTFSVVDTLLDWVDQSKLIIVGIANSKDLIEEIGRSSTKSRMFRERLCDVQFETYTYKQLQEIISDRLKQNEVFTHDAIELLARKSALSGDVRLALNLCRRILTEAGDTDISNAIDAQKVVNLLQKIHKDPKIELIKSLGKQDHILLRAIRDVILTSGLPSCSLAKNLYDQYKSICILDDVTVRDEFSLFRNLRLLESYAILTLSESDCTIHTEISLGNNIDLVQMVFLPKISR